MSPAPPLSPRRAFTLIELLIVVAIIAILAAIAVPNFLEAQTRSKNSRVRADLRTASVALEAYRVDNNKLPPEFGSRYQATTPIRRTSYTSYFNNGWGIPRDAPWEVMPFSLTTPVAYLASLPRDAYKSNLICDSGTSQGRSFESPIPADASFNYHNIKARAESAGLYPGYSQDDVKDYGDWRLFSIGPQRVWRSIGDGDVTMGWKYDPTNGTMSSGFILRTEKDPTGENFSRAQ